MKKNASDAEVQKSKSISFLNGIHFQSPPNFFIQINFQNQHT